MPTTRSIDRVVVELLRASTGLYWGVDWGGRRRFCPIRFPCASQTPSGINDVEITLIIISRSYFQIEDVLIVTFIS